MSSVASISRSTLWDKVTLRPIENHIDDVMVSVFASGDVYRRRQPKNYRISSCCFSTKNATLRSKSKDWLAQNENNESEWNDTSARRLLFQ